MIALNMEDQRACTAGLFMQETFDDWLLREASIVTYNTFTIDGHIRQGYYTDSETELLQIGELSSWKMLRPICFSLIKGKKLPGSFQIALQLPPGEVSRFRKEARLDFDEEQIAGLYLYFRYEDRTLTCVTGTSLKIFTLDKQLDREWDAYVMQYFRERKLAFTQNT